MPTARNAGLMGLAAAAALIFTDASVFAVAVAIAIGAAIFKVGFMALGGLARPIPEPPPPGELRKVKLQYRCSVCGAEVRMTAAAEELPDPPRHCTEDMDLQAPVE